MKRASMIALKSLAIIFAVGLLAGYAILQQLQLNPRSTTDNPSSQVEVDQSQFSSERVLVKETLMSSSKSLNPLDFPFIAPGSSIPTSELLLDASAQIAANNKTIDELLTASLEGNRDESPAILMPSSKMPGALRFPFISSNRTELDPADYPFVAPAPERSQDRYPSESELNSLDHKIEKLLPAEPNLPSP